MPPAPSSLWIPGLCIPSFQSSFCNWLTYWGPQTFSLGTTFYFLGYTLRRKWIWWNQVDMALQKEKKKEKTVSSANNISIHKDQGYSGLLMKNAFGCLNVEQGNQSGANIPFSAAVFTARRGRRQWQPPAGKELPGVAASRHISLTLSRRQAHRWSPQRASIWSRSPKNNELSIWCQQPAWDHKEMLCHGKINHFQHRESGPRR